MSSNYNSRPMLPEVLVDGDKFTVIRKRQTYNDLIEMENFVKKASIFYDLDKKESSEAIQFNGEMELNF